MVKANSIKIIIFSIFLASLYGCKNPDDSRQLVLNPPSADSSFSIEELYNLASNKNSRTISLTDSILYATSDQNTRSEAFYIRGLYYANIDQLDEALKYFDSSIIENYTQVDAYIEKSILLNNQKKFEAAIQTLEIALHLTKNNTDLYYWLGKSNEGLGKIIDAHKWYGLAVSIEPDFEEAKKGYNRTK